MENSFLQSATFIITCIGTVIGVLHIWKHWRDEDVKVVAVAVDQKLHTGKLLWCAWIAITNVGKPGTTPVKITLAEKRLEDSFNLRVCSRLEKTLDQGACVKALVALSANKSGVALPKSFRIKVIGSDGRDLCKLLIDTNDARPARKLNI